MHQRFDLTCQLSVHRCQKQFSFPVLDFCSIQVAYSNNHNPTSLSSPGATSAILHFECYNQKFPPETSLLFREARFVWLCHKKLWSLHSTNQPTNQPRGLPAVFPGWPAPPPPPSTKCVKGESKRFFCMSDFCLPCSSSLSPLLILIWKCPIAFI